GNFLPIRNRVTPGQTFSEYLETSKQTIMTIYDNQNYPFDKIVNFPGIKVAPSRNPLFDTMLIFHSQMKETFQRRIAGLDFTGIPMEQTTAKLDFKIDVFPAAPAEENDGTGTETRENNETLLLSLEYNSGLFKEERMQRFLHHFQELIHRALAEPEQPVEKIRLFEDGEEKELLEKRRLNATVKKKPLSLAVSATFTPELVEDYIRWWGGRFQLEIDVTFAPYNQVFQQLLDETGLLSRNEGINLLLIRFEDWLRDRGP
ncbi:MAG: polyketide synthase subunit, partial [bacterium]|nr:polyketide synthase subunit [bacterium]